MYIQIIKAGFYVDTYYFTLELEITTNMNNI